MSEDISWEIERGAQLQGALTSWVRNLGPAAIQDARYQEAFQAIDRALIETIRYMHGRKSGELQNPEREWRLTDLWSVASQAVSPIDADLANACLLKGLGWTDPSKWEAAERQGFKIGVEDMQNARMLLNAKRQALASQPPTPGWFPIAGVCFTVITIMFLMYLLLGQPLDAGKKVVFDALMAFCASASAAFLGGSAVAQGQIPFVKKSPITFSAFGGIGTFVVVFLILHYANR